uniref:F-box/LRR-repeat protein 15/At3g58940/PEG3-like LRR domain-containing protein n=1 Tax=Chenopodium quinoa TaxID=63459 RepID=A0A803L2X0_CHEQI
MKYLWTLVTTLELVDFKDERPEKFDGFVSHVLQHCKSINLEKFRLACRESRDLCLIDDWISSAVSRKPKQLILDLFGDTINFREIVLSSYPTCSITYNTIVILKLKSCFEIEIPESLASFPCLKILQFTGWFPYENHCSALDRLLSNSPVLEDLHLEGYLESEAEFEFDLCVPTLKRLRLNLKTDVHGVHPHTVTIDAPKLEDFDIADGTCAEYVMKNVGSLDFVDVDYEASWTDVPEDDHIRRLLGLLFGIAKTKELSISVDSLLNLKSSVSRPWPQFSHFDGVGVGGKYGASLAANRAGKKSLPKEKDYEFNSIATSERLRLGIATCQQMEGVGQSIDRQPEDMGASLAANKAGKKSLPKEKDSGNGEKDAAGRGEKDAAAEGMKDAAAEGEEDVAPMGVEGEDKDEFFGGSVNVGRGQ